MEKIPMKSLQYNFDDYGNGVSVDISLQSYVGRDNINARITIKPEDLEVPLDEASSKVLEEAAREKLVEWIISKEELEELEDPIGDEDGMPIEDVEEYGITEE